MTHKPNISWRTDHHFLSEVTHLNVKSIQLRNFFNKATHIISILLFDLCHYVGERIIQNTCKHQTPLFITIQMETKNVGIVPTVIPYNDKDRTIG